MTGEHGTGSRGRNGIHKGQGGAIFIAMEWMLCIFFHFQMRKGLRSKCFPFLQIPFYHVFVWDFHFVGFIYIYICLFVSLEFEVTPLRSTGCPDFIR